MYKQILEAINKGIKFALDDFEDNDIQGQTNSKVKYQGGIKEWLDLKKETVDLGLPSGTLWCKCNLGATCEPNNIKSWYGDYYAWGELEPNKKKYDWDHYKFYDGPDTKAVKDVIIKYYINKYSNYQVKDKNNVEEELLPEDDAAYQFKKCHNYKFHIPTKEQAQELLNNTKIIYVKDTSKDPKYENVQGYTGAGWFMISKINGNYIFFPETSIKEGSSFSLNKIDSGIWTSHITDSSPTSKATCAWAIKLYPSFNQDNCYSQIYGFWKYEGLPIRPVINL